MSTPAKAKLVSVLLETQDVLRRPQNDFAWSELDDAAKAISDIGSHLDCIERNDFSRLPELTLLFAPTGAIQEVAVSSGWGDEFLDLADRFDKATAAVTR